ncbi:hypothetical protein EW026_g3551 [Hermanssonia centrifuga]|uniref:Uncharacterized protein n=1 Tax=Hermanssonia centrifuga TaxID=98765 RepID=A0A4S4KJS1_9APHY|nr:hypothetical protein EW026_g3551 [Hermanssonia centrifuga]
MRAGPSPSPRQTARQPIDERSMPIHQEYPLSKGRAPTTTGSPFATSSLSTTSLGAFGGFSQFAQPQGFGLLSTARDGTNVPSRAKDPVAALATQSTEQREIDREIASYLRDLFKNETGWAEVEKSRAERTPLVKQLAHFRYMQDKFNQYVSKPAPSHLKLAANVPITKAQFLLAFNLPLAWGDDCTDALELTGLYGFGGSRCEDPEAIAMLNEVPPITTTIQVGRYLKRLRALHQQWTENHPAN